MESFPSPAGNAEGMSGNYCRLEITLDQLSEIEHPIYL